MKKAITPIRNGIASILELVASQRPDQLPVFLDIVANSPARFAVLELTSDLGVKADQDLYRIVLKIIADLDRLESRRTGWRHPNQIVTAPNVSGLLLFCRARIQNAPGIARRRQLEIMARKLQRVHDQERTRAWITDFIGTTGEPAKEREGS